MCGRLAVAVGGGVLCLAALAICLVVGHAAWRGWLAAAVLLVSIPFGAIGLVMSMRLMPGAWARQGIPLLEPQARLFPTGALALVPALAAMRAIYTWDGQRQTTAFRAAWLSEPFFVARTVIWVGLFGGLWWLLLRRPNNPAISCIGLVLFLTFGTFAATDWLQSLDPAFRSSGFGLYVISLQMLTALALALVIGLAGGAPLEKQGSVAGILLTILLFWAYLAYMPYFISWSGNVPAAAVWYLKRGRGVWAGVLGFTAACRFIPMGLLLFSHVRNGRKWLLGIALVVLAGAVPELAWLAIPAAPGAPHADAWTALAYILAVSGMALIGWARMERTPA